MIELKGYQVGLVGSSLNQFALFKFIYIEHVFELLITFWNSRDFSFLKPN